jgi:hypothetical protein
MLARLGEAVVGRDSLREFGQIGDEFPVLRITRSLRGMISAAGRAG